MPDEKQDRSPESELTGKFPRVARSPVLDDPVVIVETTDHNSPHLHLPAAECTGQRPARDNAQLIADLLVDLEPKIGKQFPIERNGLPRPIGPVILERVDMINKACAVDILYAGQITS